MTAKISASADGLKVYIGNAAEAALEINQTAKTIAAIAPYLLKGDIAAQSLTGNGYVKLASGLIIQWGFATAGAAGSAVVSFPITFPSACLAVNAIIANIPASASANVGNFTTTQFELAARTFSNSYSPESCSWIAIGY